MNMITCATCGEKIEVSAALQGQIEEQVLKAQHEKHATELARVKAEVEAQANKDTEARAALLKKRLDAEKVALQQQAEAELEVAKNQLEASAAANQKRTSAAQEMTLKNLQQETADEKRANKELREQLSVLMSELRESKKARDNAELEMQKKLDIEESKIREEVGKQADEKQRLNLAARDKTIADLQSALDAAQRKAAQGSQQLQGEIMELDFEEALANAFRDDDIQPVAKGVRGGDIRQVVKSPRGTVCGVLLWEIKRTKNWIDGWIPKLKEDLRAEKANLPIIITEVMPKQISEDMGVFGGVWVCKPQLAVILATLLRKSLLDAGLQKALAENRGTKADALFNFVTSHEFVHQVESMVETYQEMTLQVQKERIAYERIWATREKQSQRLLMGTATIIGSMQGHIGQASMPKIKGLELLEAQDEEVPALSEQTSQPRLDI